jgi:hypothetical protein
MLKLVSPGGAWLSRLYSAPCHYLVAMLVFHGLHYQKWTILPMFGHFPWNFSWFDVTLQYTQPTRCANNYDVKERYQIVTLYRKKKTILLHMFVFSKSVQKLTKIIIVQLIALIVICDLKCMIIREKKGTVLVKQ